MTEGWRLRRNPALDGFRAFAVGLVILVHAWGSAVPGGTIGVYLFFTLSGFLITGLLLSEITVSHRLSFVNFYARRALRLLPALFALLCVVFLIAHTTHVDLSRIGASLPAAMFYYANLARASGTDLGMLGHTWSLSIEEQFYLVWPLIFWLAHRAWRARGVLTAALVGSALSVASTWWLLDHHSTGLRRSNGFDTNAVALLVGCALAAALHLGLRPPRRATAIAAVASTAFLVTTALWLPLRQWTGAKPYGLGVIALAAGSILCFLDQSPDSWAGRGLATRPLVYIGRISYGIYLWHYLIVIALIRNFDLGDSAPAVVVVTILSIAVAAASYRFLESPFLLLQRYFRTTVTPDEPAVEPESSIVTTSGDGLPHG